MKDRRYSKFFNELIGLINRHSIENGSNTPDYVLAEYLVDCLKAYEEAVNFRDHQATVAAKDTGTETVD